MYTHNRDPHPAIKLWCQVHITKFKAIFQIEMYCSSAFWKANIFKVELSMIKIGKLLKTVMGLKKLLHHLATRGTYSPGYWRCDDAWREQTLGKFDWGVRHVIIFLYVQFWIRLGTVSYRGKKVRTVDSPAVRSVNKSRDTRNCVQNEPKYATCVLVATRLYYKALGIILCALI